MIKTRLLGRTGLTVSEISLGAWQFGGKSYGPVAESESQRTIQAYLEQGGNFIDTARAYGDSERILGAYFQRCGGRENIILASKMNRNTAEEIRAGVEESLRMLQTDYIDLYYIHSPPDDADEMQRVLDVYEQLKAEGKIRAIGASIKGPDVTQQTIELCRQYIQSGRVDVLMLIFSIFRQKMSEIFQEARQHGVGIVARTVLENGFLSGKYAPGHVFRQEKDHRRRWGQQRLTRILEEARHLQESAVVSPYESLTQLAIRFVLDYDGVSSVVVGSRTAQQIEGSVVVSTLSSLPADLREHLQSAFAGRDAAFNTGEDQ